MSKGLTTIRTGMTAGLLAVALLGFANSAQASVQSGRIDLRDVNVRIDGANVDQSAAHSVAGAGDVNGDGFDDVVVGAPKASNPTNYNGYASVVFGQPSLTTVDLSALGDRGFHINRATLGDGTGVSVSGAGDVDNDGLDDVIVGAPYTKGGSLQLFSIGSAYVVFGERDDPQTAQREDSQPVNLGALALESRGFRIVAVGSPINELTGKSVAGAGYVNNDDYADVIVGAPAPGVGSNPGSSYVIFGKPSTDSVELAALGDKGFRINGAAARDKAGDSVAGTGDIDGDGLDDVVVGALFADNNGLDRSGSAYVVFGKDDSNPIELAALSGKGYQIDGSAMNDEAGLSVAGTGDVNGDGLPDVVVGAPRADNNGDESGSAYVVFGKDGNTDPVQLASFGNPVNPAGFRIDGAAGSPGPGITGDRAGWSVAGAGYVNDDNYADVIVGAPQADNNGRTNSGAGYVIYGKSDNGGLDNDVVDLASFALGGAKGFRFDGAEADDFAGISVAGIGDVNGDGGADVTLGAEGADNNGRKDSGSAYLFPGFVPPTPPGPEPGPGPFITGQPNSCNKVLYENRLRVSREIRLSDLVKGKGVKVYASASEASSGSVKIEINGREARQFKIYRKTSKWKSKLFARTKVEVGAEPKAVYLKAKGGEARLIRKALRIKRAPKSTKLKVSLDTHAVAKASLERLNTQTVRALRRGKVGRTDTYLKIRQVLDKTGCGQPLRASIKGPRQTKLTVLTTKKAKQGRGTKVTVECSEDCTAMVGYRLWGRYEIGLKFRKKGQTMNRLLFERKVKLSGGEPRTLRLGGVVSNKLRKLLVRGAKKKRYDRVKLKYLIEARTADSRSGANEGTSRVPMRFR